jgi:hypothetical protein
MGVLAMGVSVLNDRFHDTAARWRNALGHAIDASPARTPNPSRTALPTAPHVSRSPSAISTSTPVVVPVVSGLTTEVQGLRGVQHFRCDKLAAEIQLALHGVFWRDWSELLTVWRDEGAPPLGCTVSAGGTTSSGLAYAEIVGGRHDTSALIIAGPFGGQIAMDGLGRRALRDVGLIDGLFPEVRYGAGLWQMEHRVDGTCPLVEAPYGQPVGTLVPWPVTEYAVAVALDDGLFPEVRPSLHGFEVRLLGADTASPIGYAIMTRFPVALEGGAATARGPGLPAANPTLSCESVDESLAGLAGPVASAAHPPSKSHD